MSSKSGCLRGGLFGCLGIVAILLIAGAIASIFALQGIKKERVEDRELVTASEITAEAPGEVGGVEALPPGRVILDLSQGEFYVHRGQPGEGVRVKARFDQEAYELADGYEVLGDGTWIYRVRYQRTIPGMQAILQAIFGGSSDSRVDIYLPPDVPIALELHVEEGGSEIELGGLWLSEAQLKVRKGGFSLSFEEPLREPVRILALDGSMGGLDASGLGNASPESLMVRWRMGGANLDLGGQWVRDCDANFSVEMGGMSVVVPRDVILEDAAPEDAALEAPPSEGGQPVLRLKTRQKRGEIDVIRR